MKNRNSSLEGIRGLASLIVVFSHLALTYWPALHSGQQADVMSGFELKVFNSPFTFFYSGTFAVCIFFVMSGFVLSFKFSRTKDDSCIRELMLKRYPRLMIPVLISVLISYLLMKFGLMFGPAAPISPWLKGAYAFQPSILDALNEGLWMSFLTGSSHYNWVLWTMKIEFLGSIGVFSLCLLLKGVRWRPLFYSLLICALIAMFGIDGGYYSLFVIGKWFSDLPAGKISSIAAAAIFLLGVYFGGYHVGSMFHSHLDGLKLAFGGNQLDTYHLANCISAILIFYAVTRSKLLSKFTARFNFLGSISFSLYLIHLPLLSSFGVYVFTRIYLSDVGYSVSAILSSSIYLVVLVFLSLIYRNSVDSKAVSFSAKMLWFLKGRSSQV